VRARVYLNKISKKVHRGAARDAREASGKLFRPRGHRVNSSSKIKAAEIAGVGRGLPSALFHLRSRARAAHRSSFNQSCVARTSFLPRPIRAANQLTATHERGELAQRRPSITREHPRADGMRRERSRHRGGCCRDSGTAVPRCSQHPSLFLSSYLPSPLHFPHLVASAGPISFRNGGGEVDSATRCSIVSLSLSRSLARL